MKKYKLFIAMLLLATSLNISSQVSAQTVVADPFIVTQAINQEVIDRSLCYTLIRNQTTAEDTSSSESQIILADIDLIQENMEATNRLYQGLNEEIASLESAEVDSLVYANQQLETVIELIYFDYLESQPDFQLLSEEEQLQQISQHEVVLEWQSYINQLQQLINEKVVLRDEHETLYYQMAYELENQSRLLEEEKLTQSQLNQCLLYPYSTTFQTVEGLLLNSQNNHLDSFLLEVDSYLQKLVPTAFRKIAYYDVYRFFTLPSDDETQTIEMLQNKEATIVDEVGLEKYSYAKELNLYDLEVLGNYAKSAFLKQENLDALRSSYLEALNIKEGQFAYFYSINLEVFADLSTQLANYLNNHHLIDEISIGKIQTLHNRYQIKLVYYDEQTQSWTRNDSDSSGYYSLYHDLSLTQAHAVDTKTGNPIEKETESLLEESSSVQSSISLSSESIGLPLPDETNNPINQNDGLDYLKDKLTNGQASSVKSGDLPKPGELSRQKDKSNEKKPSSSSSTLSLPNTGETAFWTLIGSTLLVIGLVLLLINQVIKRKRREKLEEIELD